MDSFGRYMAQGAIGIFAELLQTMEIIMPIEIQKYSNTAMCLVSGEVWWSGPSLNLCAYSLQSKSFSAQLKYSSKIYLIWLS